MKLDLNVAYNMDCMEYMKALPDKAFDLAVVDPPYGGGHSTADTRKISRTGGKWASKFGKKS